MAEGPTCISPETAVEPGSSECSGHGILSSDSTSCICNTGYTGSRCRYKMVFNIDYHGTDLPDTGPNIHCDTTTCCADLCDAYPSNACKMWVWWDLTRGCPGCCWLKSAVPSDVHEEAHLVTGIPTSIDHGGECVHVPNRWGLGWGNNTLQVGVEGCLTHSCGWNPWS